MWFEGEEGIIHSLGPKGRGAQMNDTIRKTKPRFWVEAAIVATCLLMTIPAVQAETSQEAANKKVVMSFLQQFFIDHDMTAADRYILPDFIEHNPQGSDGRDALVATFSKFPKMNMDFRHVAADGDMVWVHMKAPGGAGKPDIALVDIFRLKNGKIAEHWDVALKAAPK